MKTWRLHLTTRQRKKLTARHLAVIIALSAAVAALLALHGSSTASPYTLATPEELEAAIRSGGPVAVMFSSPTCQSCARMKPHWEKLAQAQQRIGIRFYTVELTRETAEAFRRYNVTHTPTFILFYNGRPVARHVGEFPGNATQAILEWATDALLNPQAGGAPQQPQTCAGGACTADLPAVEGGGDAALTAAAAAAAFTAGLLSPLSPCTLPILIAYTASSRAPGRRARRAAGCFAASTATVLAAGLLLALLPQPTELIEAITPFTGALLIFLGLAEALGYEPEIPSINPSRLGYWGGCSLLGLLSTQCSLPLLLGPLMLAIGAAPHIAGGALYIAASYAAGLGLTLALLLAGSGRVREALERVVGGSVYTRATGVITLAAGLILIAYSIP